MLRVAAALSLLAGAAGFLGYLSWVGKGPFAPPENRHLRAMKDRTAAPDSTLPYTFADFVALPHGRPLHEFARLEQRAVALEGHVHQMIRSMDGDFHLGISPAAGARVPDTLQVTAEITPQWTRGSPRWRWERLAAELRPQAWYPPWPRGPRRVRISGWLLYDFEYDAPHVRERRPVLPGPRGRRATGWEIHPVTRIELWDDSLQTFVEYPR